MSMQLNASNAGSFGELANFCWIRIDENADGASSRRERVHNPADDSRLDVARARWVKVEPNHVRAEFDARARIIRIFNTADFDLYRIRHGNHKRAGVWQGPSLRDRRSWVLDAAGAGGTGVPPLPFISAGSTL